SEPMFAAPVMPPVDAILLEILRSEVGQYLQVIRTVLRDQVGELPISEELLRAVHTLHGAIAMVDIGLLIQVLSPLEGLLKRLRGANVPLSSEGVDLLRQAADVVEHVMAQFDAADPQLPDVSDLAAQITAMRDLYAESRVAHVVYEPHRDEMDELAANVRAEIDAAVDGVPADTSMVGIIDTPALERAAAEKETEEREIAEREIAERDAAEREAAVLESAKRDAEEREAAERVVAEREAAERVAAEKEAAKREAAKREAAELEIVKRDAAKREAAEREAARLKTETETSATPLIDSTRAASVSAMGEVDSDLLEVFVDEARELLDHADDVLAQWRSEPGEPSHVTELRRDLHTLKGGARISGLMGIGDLAHAIETLLEKPVGDVGRAAALIGALETSFDQLNTLVQSVANGQASEYPQAGINQLLALAGEAHFADDAMLAAIAIPEPEVVPVVATASKAAAVSDDLPDLLPDTVEEVRSSQEQIRVRADLLDSLVNHAGEVAIYRSRLEQQVAGYRFNLVELEQTVSRLRSQLRMLEIETEAQIIARFQREHREAGLTTVFDPLELDRYSQLQQYSRALAESVSDLVSIQNTLDELTRQAETLL
ncbi:MAG: Hpt domain-containing protein, partial [Rhodanobacter sp.]